MEEEGYSPLEHSLFDRIVELNKQLSIEEQQNEMLIETLEQYKSEIVVLEEWRDRHEDNAIQQFERIKKLENLLLLHQEFTQWLEEQIDNDLLLNNTVFLTMTSKLNKLNHD